MSQFLPEIIQSYIPNIIQILYLITTGLFIVGIKRLGSPATARSGNQMASFGMLIGVAVTLFDQEIIAFEYIIAGVIIGSLIGIFAAKRVQMTAMPEMVAVFNGFGGGASALVAWGEFSRLNPSLFDTQSLVTTGLSILIGSITFTGSFIAFGKLKGFIGGGRIALPGQNIINLLLTVAALGLVGWFTFDPEYQLIFWILFGLALLIGVLTVLPIGGRYAGRHLTAQLLFRYCRIHGRFCARQQFANHQWCTGWSCGPDPHQHYVQSNESNAGQCSVRSFWGDGRYSRTRYGRQILSADLCR